MASEPLNSAAADQLSKKIPEEQSGEDNGNNDCTRRCQLLEDSQRPVTDGDATVCGPDSSCGKRHLQALEHQTSNYKSSRDKNEMTSKPQLDSKEPEHKTPVMLHQKPLDGLSDYPVMTRKTEDQSCILEQKFSLDTDEDLYRDEEEIEKEKIQKVASKVKKQTKDVPKLGVDPEIDILEYCQREWRGKTTAAKTMKAGYEEVSHFFGSIRRVRGDNYCALRATLFQCLSQTTEVPQWLNDDLINLPEKLIQKYDWITLWRFWHSYGTKKTCVLIKRSLELLKKKWAELSEIKIADKKQAACDEIFKNEEEYALYEAVKFLMLKTAIDLYNDNEDGKEVPVFSWLLFARNTSSNPCEFLKNHLNQVGHSGGLEQVEMFLLGYALQCTIKVYRLYKCGTNEFITQYPDDQKSWPSITLITEDDRHYNVPVRVCEETSL